MLTTELLKIQDNEAVENSYYRAPKVVPSIKKIDDYTLKVYTQEDMCLLKEIDEVVLSILVIFKYMPIWLINQWYKSQNEKSQVENWIKTGLVWIEPQPTGIYVRPTRFLLDLFNNTDTQFIDIPYNLLTHDVSEQQLLFDIKIGNQQSEIWPLIQSLELLPKYHPLKIESLEPNRGTIVIRESDFRLGFKRYKENELLSREEELYRDIQSGKEFTPELFDFTLFPIVKINTQNQENKGEIIVQTPDVLIPLPRKNKLPQSIAIEIELTAKSLDKYIGIMDSYRNNYKFGTLIYLCKNDKIARLVKQAFQKVKGLGNCTLYLVQFTPPSMRLEDFSREDEIYQKNILKLGGS